MTTTERPSFTLFYSVIVAAVLGTLLGLGLGALLKIAAGVLR